jgi:hypothetical protein
VDGFFANNGKVGCGIKIKWRMQQEIQMKCNDKNKNTLNLSLTMFLTKSLSFLGVRVFVCSPKGIPTKNRKKVEKSYFAKYKCCDVMFVVRTSLSSHTLINFRISAFFCLEYFLLLKTFRIREKQLHAGL